MQRTLKTTDQVLNKNQMLLFTNILNAIDSFEKITFEGLADITNITLNLNQALNDFIGKKKEPTVTQYLVEPYIEDYSTQNILTLKGNTLDRCDSIYMVIGDKKIPLIMNHFGSLKFDIPTDFFKSISNGDTYLKGNIVYNWKSGLFKRKKQRKDKFFVPIYPLNLGSVKIKYEQEKPYKRYGQFYNYSCSCSTSGRRAGSRKKKETYFAINPPNGGKFDIPNVKLKSFYQRYGGDFKWTTITDNLISGYITCKSERKRYGGGGSSSATFSYREYINSHSIEDYETLEYTMTSVNPLVISLPSPVDNFHARISHAEIKTFDNKLIILTPNQKNKYFSLKHNVLTDDAIVSWRH